MRKSSGILLFINIVTGVFSPCKTRSFNYLLFSVSQVRHRSVFTLKIIASKNYLVIICNSILEQICKTRSHFLNPFLAIFKPSLIAHRLCGRSVTDLFYKVCKLFGVSQIFIKFTDCTTGLLQTCKTDSVFQVCCRHVLQSSTNQAFKLFTACKLCM